MPLLDFKPIQYPADSPRPACGLRPGSHEYYGQFSSTEEYEAYRSRQSISKRKAEILKGLPFDGLTQDDRIDNFLVDNPLNCKPSIKSVFRVREFPSGEMTGAYFIQGLPNRFNPGSRSGAVETTGFTPSARKKIRRAAENAKLPLKYFVTLTFSPASLQPWEKNDDGTVRHDYAKEKLIRFRDALNKSVKRRYKEELNYIWTAEVQRNGNIHFHMLISHRIPIHSVRNETSLTKLWGQGKNAVDVRYLNDSQHVVNYITKYISKGDDSPIKGNRYNISRGLREQMKPIETTIAEMTKEDIQECGSNAPQEVLDILKCMKEDIESRGGTVLDFGFYCPAPRRPRDYVCKKTKKKKKSKGVRRDLAPSVLSIIRPEEDFDLF